MNQLVRILPAALAFVAILEGQATKEPGCPPDCTNPSLSAEEYRKFANEYRATGARSEKMAWLYRKAAEMGDSEAAYELGYCYMHGTRVPQDRSEEHTS